MIGYSVTPRHRKFGYFLLSHPSVQSDFFSHDPNLFSNHTGFHYSLYLFSRRIRFRIGQPRIITTPKERARLIRLGEGLEHKIDDVMHIVRPATYRGWLRKAEGKKPKRKGGRPPTDAETVQLILQMAKENPSWGYKRIKGELTKLNIKIGRTTISDILKLQTSDL
jgi:transposase